MSQNAAIILIFAIVIGTMLLARWLTSVLSDKVSNAVEGAYRKATGKASSGPVSLADQYGGQPSTAQPSAAQAAVAQAQALPEAPAAQPAAPKPPKRNDPWGMGL